MLRLFVYGSLKHGFANHGRYCRGLRSLELAEVAAELYRTPSGFPVLGVARENILARATIDPLNDLDTQDRFTREFERRITRPESALRNSGVRAGQTVKRRAQGEILSFADPIGRLRELDRLEDFEVNRRGAYERVLTSVFSRTRGRSIAVWVYVAGELSKNCPSILTGCWRG